MKDQFFAQQKTRIPIKDFFNSPIIGSFLFYCRCFFSFPESHCSDLDKKKWNFYGKTSKSKLLRDIIVRQSLMKINNIKEKKNHKIISDRFRVPEINPRNWLSTTRAKIFFNNFAIFNFFF